MKPTTDRKARKLAEFLELPLEDVVALAVDDLYAHIMQLYGDRLIPREDNQYDIQHGGKTIATVHAEALTGLTPDVLASLLSDGEPGGLALILAAAVRNNQGITLYPEEDQP